MRLLEPARRQLPAVKAWARERVPGQPRRAILIAIGAVVFIYVGIPILTGLLAFLVQALVFVVAAVLVIRFIPAMLFGPREEYDYEPRRRRYRHRRWY